ncbi:MAG: tRNA glutamyl-Q(34) synthetase GluQRS [Betaproteobacteria bacterium]
MTVAHAQRYVGRFAPSPTGPLHFGSLIAALASYADARAAAGTWLLRIEDLDPPREPAGAADQIVRTLERYGFQWDGAVMYQSQREPAYLAAFERLRLMDSIFPCRCSRLQLRRGKTGAGGEQVYPGTCRETVPRGAGPQAWRVKVDGTPVTFADRIQGTQAQVLSRDIGDFVVRRADQRWAYQLAVVVDDSEQRITDIVRGADLLTSTPRQIWLQRQLGVPTPAYAHVPVVVNAIGEKLSKQTRASALAMTNPETALLAAWQFLGQRPPDSRPDDPQQFWDWAIPRWDLRAVPRAPALCAEADPPVAL